MENTGKNQVFTREEVIKIVHRFGFFMSDNGDPDTSAEEWMDDMYPTDEQA